MRQIKERKKTLHELKTREIFYCLSGMPFKISDPNGVATN